MSYRSPINIQVPYREFMRRRLKTQYGEEQDSQRKDHAWVDY